MTDKIDREMWLAQAETMGVSPDVADDAHRRLQTTHGIHARPTPRRQPMALFQHEGDNMGDLVEKLDAMTEKPGTSHHTGEEFVHGFRSQEVVDALRQASTEIRSLRAALAEAEGVKGREWNYDMDAAPKDETRVIVLTPCFRWSSDVCQHIAVGKRAVEARYCSGLGGSAPEWHEWCGGEKTFSTDWIVAEAWIPLPADAARLSALQEGE